MKKKYRKARPSPPVWYWWDNDGCWWCQNRAGCNGCRHLKKYVADQKHRQLLAEKQKLRSLNLEKFLEEERVEDEVLF